jgi:hypothetical protein
VEEVPETGRPPEGIPHLPPLSEFDAGFLVGILVGEGHFGGDGRQPQVTLRMHADHGAVFGWLAARIPGSRVYGPYHHGGRHYYQWMARGGALRDQLLPILERRLRPEHSARVWERYLAMRHAYGLGRASDGRGALGRPVGVPDEGPDGQTSTG